MKFSYDALFVLKYIFSFFQSGTYLLKNLHILPAI